MARYIDAEAVKKMVADIMSDCKVTHKHRALNRNLKQIPTADVAPVKHGEWVSCKNNSGYKCSNCGARIKNSDKFNGNHVWCHKCGARMDGVTDTNVGSKNEEEGAE